MKHHFIDLLDRTGDYWTVVPNRERYAYMADHNIKNKKAVRILTISKQHQNWEQVFECPNIEEVTLHDPGKEQVQAIQKLTRLKRLRVTFFRAKDIEFVSKLENLEELILEYVSGFSDLSPLQKLKKLKSLHLENLRKVSNFDGLKGLKSLRYLHIDGTLDWKQPIDTFSFLEALPNLEILAFGFVTNKTGFPAFLPILKLKKLKQIKIGLGTFNTKEYAFLQTAFPKVKTGTFGDVGWPLCYELSAGHIHFLGKGAGYATPSSPNAKEKIEAFKRKFEEYKKESEEVIKRSRA